MKERRSTWVVFPRMPDEKIYDEPTEVRAKEGNVVLDGPDHVDVVVTPEAAVETGERLIDKAAYAAGQRRLKDRPTDN